MRHPFKITLVALAACSIALSSCKKDDEADFLVDASCWKAVKSEYKDPVTGQFTEDPIDACDADDCLIFKKDGKSVYEEGATKCDANDPQTTEGTWTLSDDKKTLTLSDPNNGTFAFTVVELTKTKLVVTANLFISEVRQTFEAN